MNLRRSSGKKILFEAFLNAFLKNQQARYVKDLKQELEWRK